MELKPPTQEIGNSEAKPVPAIQTAMPEFPAMFWDVKWADSDFPESLSFSQSEPAQKFLLRKH